MSVCLKADTEQPTYIPPKRAKNTCRERVRGFIWGKHIPLLPNQLPPSHSCHSTRHWEQTMPPKKWARGSQPAPDQPSGPYSMHTWAGHPRCSWAPICKDSATVPQRLQKAGASGGLHNAPPGLKAQLCPQPRQDIILNILYILAKIMQQMGSLAEEKASRDETSELGPSSHGYKEQAP